MRVVLIYTMEKIIPLILAKSQFRLIYHVCQPQAAATFNLEFSWISFPSLKAKLRCLFNKFWLDVQMFDLQIIQLMSTGSWIMKEHFTLKTFPGFGTGNNLAQKWNKDLHTPSLPLFLSLSHTHMHTVNSFKWDWSTDRLSQQQHPAYSFICNIHLPLCGSVKHSDVVRKLFRITRA